MAVSSTGRYSCSLASQLLPRIRHPANRPSLLPLRPSSSPLRLTARTRLVAAAKRNSSPDNGRKSGEAKEEEKEEVVEVEEDLPWIQEKALDLVEFTGSVSQALPGPRVGTSSLPWLLVLPLAYAGVTFVIAFVKTVRKFTSPRAKRKRLVNKNATLCKSIDELFQRARDGVTQEALKSLARNTDFGTNEILRKYIRYALNEKPFNPNLIADLIQLRKASGLDDSQVAEVLNEISRRIVQDKGPVVMDMSGYTERGFKRKLAVQTLFGKIFYLSELPVFCSRDNSLVIKEIFGVSDEDADQLRIHTLSEAGDLDSLKQMADNDDSESGKPTNEMSSEP